MPAKLIVVRGREPDRVFELNEEQVTELGRSVKCDVRLPDSQASRKHCRVRFTDGEWTLTDLNSSNGSFVNRERVTETALRPGDLVKVGTTVLKFGIDGIPDSQALGGTELLIDEDSSNDLRPPQDEEFELFTEPEEKSNLLAPDAAVQPESLRCAQCGRDLAADAAARGEATDIGGRLYCSRCVVQHPSDTSDGAPDNDQKQSSSSESYEIESLLQSLERVTEADQMDSNSPPAQKPVPPPKKRGLLDRLRGRKTDDASDA